MRRLTWTVGAVVFVDTMFYAVIAPLLPQLTHELHMSKLSAGVLTACYPLGTLLASIPGGVLAVRAGPRFALCTGLALLGCSTIAFAFIRFEVGLDAARFVEGVGGACSWAGGLAWLVAETPTERRGATIGGALGAAIGGALFGPAIGALASVTGRPALFSALAGLAVVLIALTRGLPYHGRSSGQGVAVLLRVVREPKTWTGMWLMVLPSIVSGTINVLGPLRLHTFGAGAGAIGATFLVASGFEALIAPFVGGLSDRRGRLAPVRVGLAGTAIALLCFTLPDSALPLAALIVATVCALGALWAPAMAMLSDTAEGRGVDQALAAALMNLAWAGGQIIGSAGGGASAKAFGDGFPTATSAGLCALTLLALSIARGRSGARA
jgi:predicted MFS family arabinose efflux permease